MLSILSFVLTASLLLDQTPAAGGRLTFTAPDGWKPRPTSSTMRVAEFVLPKVDGDPEDADLVVYYFGASQGGDVEANINRWLGQMQQPDGRPSKEVATRVAETVNGLQITMLELSGTYIAEVRPGAAEHFNKPHFRMRTAVIPTPAGPYFLKMLGPDKTVRKWSDSFAAFVKTIRFDM